MDLFENFPPRDKDRFAKRKRFMNVILYSLLFGFFVGADGKGPTKTLQDILRYNGQGIAGELPVKGGGAKERATRGGEAVDLQTLVGDSGVTVDNVTALPASWTNRPQEAAVYERWTRFGVSRDKAYMPADVWRFLVRGVPVRGLQFSSDGSLVFNRNDDAPAATNRLSVLRGEMGIMPDRGGCFWHCVTASGGIVLTWEHVFLERDPALPVTFQIELWNNGDFAFRYALLGEASEYETALAESWLGVTLGGKGGTATLGDITVEVEEEDVSLLAFILANPEGVEIHFRRPSLP